MTRYLRILGIAAFVLSHSSGLVPYVTSSTAYAQLGKPEGLYYKSWAIVIGIEGYVVAPPVLGAVNDAKRVAQAFQQLGFDEVVEIYEKDAVFRRLQQVLNDMLPRKVGRMDRLVIFYAGHAGAAQDVDGEDRSYLVPADAQVNNVAKAVTVEHLKEFTRRSASKHTLLILDAPVFGWELTAPQPLSLEGRLAPEADIDRRVVQVISAARKGERSFRSDGKSLFVQALLAGLAGAADADKNGWLMASELGAYLAQRVQADSQGAQHPTSLRIDGDGDTVLVEGRMVTLLPDGELQDSMARQRAARSHYEQAFAMLQAGKPAAEALERLNLAIAQDPTYGDAYVLKSYVHLEAVPNLDEALASGQLAVQHASANPDSFYMLGLVQEKRGKFLEAETALLQALKVNAGYQDVYFSLGTLYADHLNDQLKSIEAFRRYLELGGAHARARAAVTEADQAARPKP
ncbi:MAG: caspase family protein [Nitrospira sp.]|nr:caspase family protein [Nitrospira sp.]